MFAFKCKFPLYNFGAKVILEPGLLMASPSDGDDDVVDVTMEREGEEEDEVEENVEEVEEDAERQEKEVEEEEEVDEKYAEEEQKVVELDGDEDEHKQEDSEEDEVQFVGSVEATNGHQETEEDEEEDEEKHQQEDNDVVIVESQERSRANTNALMAANGYVTPATLEAELQCIICQYAMFKVPFTFIGRC